MRSAVQSFAVDDVDLATEIWGRYFFSNRIRPMGDPSNFRAELAVGRAASVTAGLLRFHCEVEAEVNDLDSAYSMCLPLQGELHARIGHAEVVGNPDAAMMIGRVDRADFRGWPAGTEQVLILTFGRHALEAELGRLIGRDDVGSISFESLIDLKTGQGDAWAQLLNSIISGLETADGLVFHPLMAAQFSSTLMASLLLVSDHDYRALLDQGARPVRPAVIQRAINFIESHAQEPLTVPLIAASAGVSVRTLQRGFLSHVGVTPNRYLARVRMDLVHTDLLTATPESASVSEIASRWGFAHLGRFAAEYRAYYGRAPSKTLRDRGFSSN